MLLVARVEGDSRLFGEVTLLFVVEEALLAAKDLLVVGGDEAGVVGDGVATRSR